MTNVLSIDGVGGTPSDVAVKIFDQSKWQRLSSVRDANSGRETTTYVDNTSDPNSPVILAVSSAVDAKADAAGTRMRRSSITFSTFARVVDGDGALLALKKASCVIAINLPDADMETTDVRDLVMNAYSGTFTALETKVPNLVVLGALRFGITDIFG